MHYLDNSNCTENAQSTIEKPTEGTCQEFISLKIVVHIIFAIEEIVSKDLEPMLFPLIFLARMFLGCKMTSSIACSAVHGNSSENEMPKIAFGMKQNEV